MNLANAINKLEKSGYEVSGNIGSYVAYNGYNEITFFENGLGTNKTGKFTSCTNDECAPTYGLSLKNAIG